MNYEVYLRNDEGKRGSLVNGIVSVTSLMRFNQPVKWTITGAGLEDCPLADNARIAIFRDGKLQYCGYVNSKETKYDAKTRIYDWEVSGLSDLGKLSDRLTYPDPAVTPPNPNDSYSATGLHSVILLNAIDINAGANANSNRRDEKLIISEQRPVGDTETIDWKLDSLLKMVQDSLKSSEIQIHETWDLSNGTWDIKIGNPQDVSDKVIFSVDNGSISSWERTVTAPKANYLIVTGCQDDNKQYLYTRVYDQASIDKWGRIEGVVSRSDIKRIIEKDENNQVTYEEPWASVMERLETAAYEELEKATAKLGYKITTTEVNRNVYQEDYDIGSIVSVRIGGDEFFAKVDEIKITYSKGVETITPSIGTMQKGELQSVFTELGTLKEQIKVLQKGM